jgi:hypothetical protein
MAKNKKSVPARAKSRSSCQNELHNRQQVSPEASIGYPYDKAASRQPAPLSALAAQVCSFLLMQMELDRLAAGETRANIEARREIRRKVNRCLPPLLLKSHEEVLPDSPEYSTSIKKFKALLQRAGLPSPEAEFRIDYYQREAQRVHPAPLRKFLRDPRWAEAVRTELEYLQRFEEAGGHVDEYLNRYEAIKAGYRANVTDGSIEQELILRDLEEATAKREWMSIDGLYFRGFLHNDKCKGISRRGRPPDPEVEFKSKRIAAYTMLLQLEDELVKAAVDDSMKIYGVKRSTVFAARKQWCPQLRKLGFGQIGSAERREKIEWFRDIERRKRTASDQS